MFILFSCRVSGPEAIGTKTKPVNLNKENAIAELGVCVFSRFQIKKEPGKPNT